jgi:hypothetical protein
VLDVEIHGDVDHWYVPVDRTARVYQLQIGYRAPGQPFFVMARSNRVQMPRPGSDSLRPRAGARPVRTGAAPEVTVELERRPSYDLRALPATTLKGASNGAAPPPGADVPPVPVELRLHAELIVHGTTDPNAELKLLGDRIPISRDGTFSQRFSLPEGRQVIDAVVTTRNGCHQRTIVLGIERNTKELEPQWFDEIEG